MVATEDLLREHAPRALAALARRIGNLPDAEDALQEALLAASRQWFAGGTDGGAPDDPTAWLVTVGARRHVDRVRSESARREREDSVVGQGVVGQGVVGQGVVGQGAVGPPSRDDSLALLFSCAHPALSARAAVPLMLRAVGGLATREIARVLLLTDAAVNQRIHRAKEAIRASDEGFRLPTPAEWPERLRTVLAVLTLLTTSGNTADGPAEAATEALRLTRQVDALLPDEPEVGGLLALVLLTEARRPARTGAVGQLVPLDEQDRGRWDAAMIAEGTARLERAMARGRVGVLQLQAAIAAVHAEAATYAETDWPQIAALYGVLARIDPSPVVTLNRAVALGEVDGPAAGLRLLDDLEPEATRLGHRLPAARAHLLERAGDRAGAHAAYRAAAAAAPGVAERDALTLRAARCAHLNGC